MIFTSSEPKKPCSSSLSARSRAPKAQVVQAHPLLLERCACVLGRRRVDPDRGASADAVVTRVGIDHRLQPEKRQLAVELAAALEIRRGQKNMRDTVDFHRLPLRRQNIFG